MSVAESAEVIGERWPADPHAPPPVTASPLTWSEMLLAWPLVPLAPRWIGSYLARSSFIPALLAQVAAAALLWCSALALQMQQGSAALRDPIGASPSVVVNYLWVPVNTAVDEYLLGYPMARLVGEPRLGLYVIGGVLLAPWLLAFALMPFIAAGEPRGLLYLRALKLLYWSGVALAAAVFMWEWTVAVVRWRVGTTENDEVGPQVRAIAAPLLALWWWSVALRLGARYSDPHPERAGAGPLARCLGCGYLLTGLKLDGRCPECGLAIAESRPDTKELPPAETLRGLRWCRVLLGVWNPQAFIRRYAVRRPTGPAQRVAWTALLLGGLVSGTLGGIVDVSVRSLPMREASGELLGIALAFFVVGLVWLIACALLIGLLSRGDLRPRINILCYTAPALIIMALAPPAIGFFWAPNSPVAAWAAAHGAFGDKVELALLAVPFILLFLGPALHVLLFTRGLRTTRHMLS